MTLTSAGVLSGTPASGGGVYDFTVASSNANNQDGFQSFDLTVNEAPSISSASSTVFLPGPGNTFGFTAAGYPAANFDSADLPTGLSLSSGGTLSGTPAAGGGNYTFTVTADNGIGQAASQTFTLTAEQVPSITSSASTVFTLGAANSFAVTSIGYPAPTFGSSDLPSGLSLTSTGVLSGTPATGVGVYNFVLTASNGVSQPAVQDFTLTVDQAVVNSAAARLSVSGYASPSASGTPEAITVSALDASGNVVGNFTGTVTLTTSDAQSTFDALTYTFTPADGGTHEFVGTLATPGTQSILAMDLGDGLIGSQRGIVVTANSATSLVVSGYTAATVAGAAHSFTVTAVDAGGNVATGFTGTVTLSSSDGRAALGAGLPTPLTYTFTAADRGVHTFSSVVLETAGVQGLTATDGADGLSGTEGGIVVTAGPATSLVVSGMPAATVAGATTLFTVTAEDAYGNAATGYAGTVTLSSSDPRAVLSPSTYTFSAANGGVETFDGTLGTAGTQSLTVTDAADGLSTVQGNIVVTAGAVRSLVVTGYPLTTTAGVVQTYTVTARDAFGNVVTGFAGTVALSSSDSQAALAGGARRGRARRGSPDPADVHVQRIRQRRAHVQWGVGDGGHAVADGDGRGGRSDWERERHRGDGGCGPQPDGDRPAGGGNGGHGVAVHGDGTGRLRQRGGGLYGHGDVREQRRSGGAEPVVCVRRHGQRGAHVQRRAGDGGQRVADGERRGRRFGGWCERHRGDGRGGGEPGGVRLPIGDDGRCVGGLHDRGGGRLRQPGDGLRGHGDAVSQRQPGGVGDGARRGSPRARRGSPDPDDVHVQRGHGGGVVHGDAGDGGCAVADGDGRGSRLAGNGERYRGVGGCGA